MISFSLRKNCHEKIENFRYTWERGRLAHALKAKKPSKNEHKKRKSDLEGQIKILLRKRAIIESVNDQLKNISMIEHSRYRSLASFLVNIVAALLAYSFKDKKPSLNLRVKNLALAA